MSRALLLLLALALPASVAAQDRLEATVTQIAGAEAYLDVGRDDGLATGDTLRTWREGVFLGRLRVVQAASASALVGFVAETFTLTRGERIEVEVPVRAAPPVVAEEPRTPVVPERTSILDAPEADRVGSATPIRLTGRLQVGADALQSTTAFGGVETARQFATPFAALRADVTGLPGGWRARINGRGQVRTLDGAMVEDGAEARIYALDVEGDVGGATVRLGRFVPRRERFTGAWDGADLSIGSESLGAGVVAGWRPSRAAGLPDGDRAGTLAYAFASRRTGDLRLDASASGGAVFEGEALPFAGATASASGRAGDLRLRASVEVLADARPGDTWDFARLGARLSASPSRALTLRGYARQYRPSVVDGATLVARFAPSQAVGTGATLSVRTVTLRGDLALRGTRGAGDWSTSTTGGASLRRLLGSPLDLDASATLWSRDGRDAVYGSLGLGANVGAARATVGYRLSQTPAGSETLTTHGLDASLHAPLTSRLALSLRGGISDGDGLGRTWLYTALWYRL